MPKSKSSLTVLEKIWYEKLAASGFHDIEHKNTYLKEWDSQYFQTRYSPDLFSLKQSYFTLAEAFLNEGEFPSELERDIWALHADGLSYREIAKELRTKHSPHCQLRQCEIFCSFSGIEQKHMDAMTLNKDKINSIIRKLKKEMLGAFRKKRTALEDESFG